MKTLSMFLSMFLVVTVSGNLSAAQDEQKTDQVFATCVDIVDRNTIKINILGKTRELRLIGVDVGSKGIYKKIQNLFGIGSVGYLKEKVKGEKLYIEFEKGWEDPTKMLQGYVHLKNSRTFINIEMIKLGYAKADRSADYKYRKEFEQAEKSKK